MSEARVAALREPGLLRRSQSFRLMWGAQTISVFGDAVTLVALPAIAILALDASPLLVGILTAAGWVSWPLCALVAGVWVDRLPRKPLLVGADVARVLLLTSIPVAYFAEMLTVWHLVAVAALSGAATVVFGLAYTAHVPDLVDVRDLTEANARLEVSRSAATLSGPAAGGGLVGVAGAPVALVADAVSFAISAAMLARLPANARPPAVVRDRFRSELRRGVSELRARPPLVASLAAAAIANFGLAMTQAVIFVFAYRGLEMSPAAVGGALTIGAVGNVVGAVLARRWTRRLGLHRSLAYATTIEGLAGLAIPLALLGAPIVLLGLALALRGLVGPLWEVSAVTLRQVLVPAAFQARVTATARTVGMGTLPLGALVGGVLGGYAGGELGTTTGTAAVIALASIIGGLSVLPLLIARARGVGVDRVSYEVR